MNQFLKSLLVVTAIGFSNFSWAQSSNEHEEHHPAPQSTDTKKEEGHGGMGGHHMNHEGMGHMKGMMDECMKNHKDGKMCQGQMMEQCQAKMGKEECQKMMKNMKAKKSKS